MGVDLTQHGHRQTNVCIQMDSDESRFNVSLIMGGGGGGGGAQSETEMTASIL